jgi:hypothetical protein
MDNEEVCKSDIWYKQADMSQIKRSAILDSKVANRYGFGSLLTNTYGRKCLATQDALNTWSSKGNSGRGLERYINDEYAAQRADIRRRTIQSILRAQDKMIEESPTGTDPDHAMTVLSRLSEVFSRDSTNFSRAMGIADELAILNMGKQTHSMQKLVPVPRTKSPKSPSCVMEFANTNCRNVTSAFKLHFIQSEEQPFFL